MYIHAVCVACAQQDDILFICRYCSTPWLVNTLNEQFTQPLLNFHKSMPETVRGRWPLLQGRTDGRRD